MFLTNIRNARKRMYMALRLYTKENVPKVVYVYLEEGNKSAKYGVTLKSIRFVKKGVNKVKTI